MRSIPLQCTIWTEDDNPIHVTGALYPGEPGRRGTYGELMEPDDPDEYEIISVEDEDGRPVELSEEQEEEALEKLTNQ